MAEIGYSLAGIRSPEEFQWEFGSPANATEKKKIETDIKGGPRITVSTPHRDIQSQVCAVCSVYMPRNRMRAIQSIGT